MNVRHPARAIRLTIGWSEDLIQEFGEISSVRSACHTGAGGPLVIVHFDAVLVSMLTTWTRRLIGSIGALASLGLSLP